MSDGNESGAAGREQPGAFTLAHVSDWHTTDLGGAAFSDLFGKRLSGWLSWKWKRHRAHRPEILEALFRDLAEQAPDHVAVTGDLTNVALEQEFRAAAALLERLGSPDWVSLVPGNHDAYVAIDPARSWDLWADYLASDDAGRPAPRAPRHDEFPTLRVRAGVAIVGLCTAHPTPVFRAWGSLGTAQLGRLEPLLRELGERGLCRVVLIHHSPTGAEGSQRRRLADREPLHDVLARAGAELVLHGHGHRTVSTTLAGPGGAIPVVGVRSASHAPDHPEKRAQYHLYRIEPSGRDAGRFALTWRTRGFDPGSGRFVDEGEQRVLGA